MSHLNNNNLICHLLSNLERIRANSGEQYKAKAYNKAILTIKNLNFEVTSVDQVKNLSGIGKSISSKIDEILKTGTLREISNISPNGDEEVNVTKLFETIERVGPKTAKLWYDSGYRKISDIPRNVCTEAQWTAVQFHHELTQRIDRTEIDTFNETLKSFLDGKGIYFEICGSYRRGLPNSGDIDILVMESPSMDTLTEVLNCPIFTHTLAKGKKKYLGIGKLPGDNYLHRRIDIEIVKEEEYPYALMYFTGPMEFNVIMRQTAASLGFRLNEKSLLDNRGVKIACRDEHDIFAILNMEYLTPQERDKYRL
jgi:DNA polymerase/3'-5' exonuclease PolX